MKSPLCLREAIDLYLRSRRALGFGLKKEEQGLRSLLRHAQHVHHRGRLTEDLALQWARSPQDADPMWWAKRLIVVRGLARFWQAFDPKVPVPPPGVFGPSNRRRPVHIYTGGELAALLRAAGALGPAGDLRAATGKTLLGLLSCTGLRIAEALHLQMDDFDRGAATLLIRKSKGGQTRMVPLKPSSVRALERYLRVCQPDRLRSKSTALFLWRHAKPLSYKVVRTAFHSLRKRLGWLTAPMPRLHDLRHTFAIKRLTSWQRQGTERIDQRMLALATYLGHQNIQHTYWYLSATPELLACASKRLAWGGREEVAHE